MTLIVSPADFPSKEILRRNLDAGCMIYNPSIMGEWVKPANQLPIGFDDVVTNHPLRTKFAQIKRTANGWKVT